MKITSLGEFAWKDTRFQYESTYVVLYSTKAERWFGGCSVQHCEILLYVRD